MSGSEANVARYAACILAAAVAVAAAAQTGRIEDVRAFFDGELHLLSEARTNSAARAVTVRRYERQSHPVYVLAAEADGTVDASGLLPVPVADADDRIAAVDLSDGVISWPADLSALRVTRAGVLLADVRQLPFRTSWADMSPLEIVDAIYRPHDLRHPAKRDWSSEPWAKMPTDRFLPCFDRYGQFKWREWPGKTHSDEELKAAAEEESRDLAAHPGPADRNRFGGWTDGPRLRATGRFRVEKSGGKWWLVDPEGRLFWSWGPVRVNASSALTPLNGNPRSPLTGGDLPDRDVLFEDLPKPGTELAAFYDTADELLLRFYLKRNETRRYDFSSANVFRKYGKDWFAKYSDVCHRRLRSWGCNTIANSSDRRICLQDRTPYAERVEVDSRVISGSWGQWFKFRDPFDSSFKPACRRALEAHGRAAHDPWCIGFFIDNEIQWGRTDTDLARWTLWSADDQPAKVEFLRRLAAKGLDGRADKVPEAELRAFTAAIVDEYFRRTREAVKEFDEGLLYLGCRFASAGLYAPWAVKACAKYCDVLSLNIYGVGVGGFALPDKADVPVLVGEFHFGAHDRGLFGAGLRPCGSQAERCAALRNFVSSALSNPLVVGAHWHQFSDQATSGRFDGECFQVGWTDICDRPYAETVETLRSIDIYRERMTEKK